MKKYSRNYLPDAIQRQSQATEAGIIRTRKYKKPVFMKKYGISSKDLAEWFGYSNANSFYNAHCRQDIIDGVEAIIQHIENIKDKP